MGFADGVADATLGGALELIKLWLSDAVNAGLLPTKPELLEMAENTFDTYLAPSPPLAGRPFLTKMARMGFLAAVSALYDAIA